MERTYVSPQVYLTTVTSGEHRPIQPKKKPEINYPFLLSLAEKVRLPVTFLSSMFTNIKRTPIQHQRKDAPKIIRRAISERLTDIIEVECKEPGRVLFTAIGKRSGIKYRILMRSNYSSVVGRPKRV